jgi:hypothetical protein
MPRRDTVLVLNLKGGIGNQLFQYAAGLAIARRAAVPLRVDCESGFRGDPYARTFELGGFQITAEVVKGGERLSMARRTWKTEYLRRREMVRTRWFSLYHDPLLHSLPIRSPLLMDNYLQSPVYFADCEDVVRSELRGREGTPSWRDGPAQQKGSVAVHVRRRHGVTAGGVWTPAATYYGSCSLRFYQRAVAVIRQRVRDARLYLFGDDLAGLREVFSEALGGATAVTTGSALGDFQVMRQCSHFVLSNSTFSWWAAWLGAGPRSMVCFPSVWNRGEPRFPRDMMPSNWVRIPVSEKVGFF